MLLCTKLRIDRRIVEWLRLRDSTTQALDAVDSMAFSAMRFCKLRSANPSRGQGNSALIAALVADGSSIGGLESEIRLPDGDKVARGPIFASISLPSCTCIHEIMGH